MKEKKYAFFQNRECEYFPCHKVKNDEDFNCLFCYCPLYALGKKCGGNFSYNDHGYKDCSKCLYPHVRGNYEGVAARYKDIMNVVSEMDKIEDKSGKS
ncbi:MAG: cysteine-rich small domain-containing protein [Clostridia bacterium]|nr:cysteine-rich small domain-containing protein [Clostridia bacterium]